MTDTNASLKACPTLCEVEDVISAWAFTHCIDGSLRNDLFKRLRSRTPPESSEPTESLVEQFERMGDEYTDGKARFGEVVPTAAAVASAYYTAAEIARRHEATPLAALIEGLHAQVFGVHSLGDPRHSHDALADGGQIHEAVHALVRALPPPPVHP